MAGCPAGALPRRCGAPAPFASRHVRPRARPCVRVRESQASTVRIAQGAPAPPTAQQQQAQQGLVAAGAARKTFVPFRPDFYSSQAVKLSGSWDDWSNTITLQADPATGEHGTVLELDGSVQGELTFKYNVGGKWHLSSADASASDLQGCVNNTTCGRKLVRFSFPAGVFSGPRGGGEQTVHLVGSFTGWQVVIPMALGSDGAFHCDVALPPGHHTFRFLLNAHAGAGEPDVWQPMAALVPGGSAGGPGGAARPQYAVLAHLPVQALPGGVQVNSLRVPRPPGFTLLYHTPFTEAYVSYRLRGSQEPPRHVRMHHQRGCGGLMVVHLPAPRADAELEFSVTGAAWGADGGGGGATATLTSLDEEFGWVAGRRGGGSRGPKRDPAAPGTSYVAPSPGTWRLEGGTLRLDEASQLPPIMLCTDLDGTLIEDQAEPSDWVRAADEATAAAGQYFGQHLGVAGGVVVYNTGRSIGMVEGLLQKKAGVMPWPSAVVTAVGTKVFLWDVAARRWTPDPAYAALLDEGWDLEEVSRVARALMKRFGGASTVVDDGSEHPHRLSLSIRSDALDEFVSEWSGALGRAGVSHQMVASIGGEWRYVDCIAANGGKGRAMAYLAARFGIALEDVVAAGDSGNDLLMLGRLPEGPHPAIVMSNSHPEVWDWLAALPPEERAWVYTPKAERAAGIMEGLRAVVADKLAAKAERQRAKQQRRALQPQQGGGRAPTRALRG